MCKTMHKTMGGSAYEWVRTKTNFGQGAAPDPNGGDCFAPRDPPATPEAIYSAWG